MQFYFLIKVNIYLYLLYIIIIYGIYIYTLILKILCQDIMTTRADNLEYRPFDNKYDMTATMRTTSTTLRTRDAFHTSHEY